MVVRLIVEVDDLIKGKANNKQLKHLSNLPFISTTTQQFSNPTIKQFNNLVIPSSCFFHIFVILPTHALKPHSLCFKIISKLPGVI
jgi:hypothetical protein